MNKKLTFALALAFIFVFLIAFRSKIGQLISLDKPSEEQTNENSPSPSASLFSPTPTPTPSISQVLVISSRPSPVVPSQVSAYRGRPVEEVRPDPEEVKLFSESQKQDLYRSLQNFGKSVKENNNSFSGWLQLGLLKKIIGDYIGARDAWEYASILRPLNDVSFANLGELYWRYLHLYSQAEANLKMAIKNNPHDPGTYATLSDLYFYSIKEKADLADDVLLEGIAANPTSTDIPKSLARLYEKSGEYAKAIEWWQKLLAQDPANTQIAATIDGLKKKLGQ